LNATKLVVESVSKRYGASCWGLKDVSFELERGVVGLLGPNGAGKSTLMRILATITRPSSGRVLWNDVDITRRPEALRPELGYLPQDFGVYPHLSAIELLDYMAAVKGLRRAAARRRIVSLLELLNLSNAARRPLGTYSGGMRQRVGIAVALLNDPRLLIMDEPSVGLDPAERVGLRNLLSDLATERLILLSTHIVSDVEAVASSLVLISGGRLVQKASPEELLRRTTGRVWEWTVPTGELAALRRRHVVGAAIRGEEGVRVRVVAGEKPVDAATAVAASLEDAYLDLAAGPGRGERA
jgi:ABC-type multidrug transport system ATPase subunit